MMTMHRGREVVTWKTCGTRPTARTLKCKGKSGPLMMMLLLLLVMVVVVWGVGQIDEKDPYVGLTDKWLELWEMVSMTRFCFCLLDDHPFKIKTHRTHSFPQYLMVTNTLRRRLGFPEAYDNKRQQLGGPTAANNTALRWVRSSLSTLPLLRLLILGVTTFQKRSQTALQDGWWHNKG